MGFHTKNLHFFVTFQKVFLLKDALNALTGDSKVKTTVTNSFFKEL